MELTETQKHWIINEFFLVFNVKYETWIHIANGMVKGEEIGYLNGHSNIWFGRPINKFIETRSENTTSDNKTYNSRTHFYKLNIEEFLKSNEYRAAYNKRIESLSKALEVAVNHLSDMDNIAPIIN